MPNDDYIDLWTSGWDLVTEEIMNAPIPTLDEIFELILKREGSR